MMEEQHSSAKTVLHSGAEYLDGIAADIEKQAQDMDARAQQTVHPEVRDGYLRFAEVLRHCLQELRDKSRELRG